MPHIEWLNHTVVWKTAMKPYQEMQVKAILQLLADASWELPLT
jgi:hypothetical protein